MPTEKNLSNLIINKVESKAVYDYMTANNLVNEDELYLVSGDDEIKIDVDAELSSTSGNPVQNKVVTEAISDLQSLVGDTSVASQIATATANKVDKVDGKGLSTNDYTTDEKNKLAGIEAGANKTTVDSTLSSTSTNPVQNKVINATISNLSQLVNDAVDTASSAVAAHNTSDAAHTDLRALIEGLTNRLNALADSDDTTLDQMSEIVAYIKSNKTLIDAVTTGKVSVSDIVDNLTTNASGKVLSAAQGVALKAMIDGIVIPTALPNPNKLKLSGAVTAEYDGSAEVIVEIPEGGTEQLLPASGTSWGHPELDILNNDRIENATLMSTEGNLAHNVCLCGLPSGIANVWTENTSGGTVDYSDASGSVHSKLRFACNYYGIWNNIDSTYFTLNNDVFEPFAAGTEVTDLNGNAYTIVSDSDNMIFNVDNTLHLFTMAYGSDGKYHIVHTSGTVSRGGSWTPSGIFTEVSLSVNGEIGVYNFTRINEEWMAFPQINTKPIISGTTARFTLSINGKGIAFMRIDTSDPTVWIYDTFLERDDIHLEVCMTGGHWISNSVAYYVVVYRTKKGYARLIELKSDYSVLNEYILPGCNSRPRFLQINKGKYVLITGGYDRGCCRGYMFDFTVTPTLASPVHWLTSETNITDYVDVIAVGKVNANWQLYIAGTNKKASDKKGVSYTTVFCDPSQATTAKTNILKAVHGEYLSEAYNLPIASATQLGGVMPAAKTDKMTQAVGVDEAGGLWTRGTSEIDLETLTAYEAGAVIPVRRDDTIVDEIVPMMNTRYFENCTTIAIEPEQTNGVNNVIHESVIVRGNGTLAVVVYLENMTGNTTDVAIKGGDTRIRARYISDYYYGFGNDASTKTVGDAVDIMFPGVVMSDGTEAYGGFGTCTAFCDDTSKVFVIAEGWKTSTEYGIYISYADFGTTKYWDPPTDIVWSAPEPLMLTYDGNTVPFSGSSIAAACGLSNAIIQANNQVWRRDSQYYLAVNIRAQGVAVLTSSDGITWEFKGFFTTKYKCMFISESACALDGSNTYLWVANRNSNASSTVSYDCNRTNYLTLLQIKISDWTLVREYNIPDCGVKPWFIAPFIINTMNHKTSAIGLLHNPYHRDAAEIVLIGGIYNAGGNYPICSMGEIRGGANYITAYGSQSAGKLSNVMTCGTNGLVTERKGALVHCFPGFASRMNIEPSLLEWKKLPDAPKREVQTGTGWFNLKPNVQYVNTTDSLQRYSYSLVGITDTTIQNKYMFSFRSGATPTIFSPPSDVIVPEGFAIEANKIYEIEICEGRLSYKTWPYTPPETT